MGLIWLNGKHLDGFYPPKCPTCGHDGSGTRLWRCPYCGTRCCYICSTDMERQFGESRSKCNNCGKVYNSDVDGPNCIGFIEN